MLWRHRWLIGIGGFDVRRQLGPVRGLTLSSPVVPACRDIATGPLALQERALLARTNPATDAFSPEDRPHFCGLAEDDGKVPDLPFAIIVPVSLVAQWVSELKSFVGGKKLEVYVFPTAAVDWPAFWAPTSAWAKSTQPLYLRVIIFQHSVRTSIPVSCFHY